MPLYRHYKTKKIYRTIGEAIHTETGEVLILYTSIDNHQQIFARPKEIFFGRVSIDNSIHRFEVVSEY